MVQNSYSFTHISRIVRVSHRMFVSLSLIQVATRGRGE